MALSVAEFKHKSPHVLSNPIRELDFIRREATVYHVHKPTRVPVADSPNRPSLARLWKVAYMAQLRRKNLRTFTYAGCKFGIVYLGVDLAVCDLATRKVLVRSPSSMTSLEAILGTTAH